MTTLIKTSVLRLSVDEVKTLLDELKFTYVNKENEEYARLLNKMSAFLSVQGSSNAGQDKDN